MPLDPAAEMICSLLAQLDGPAIAEQTPDEARAGYAALTAMSTADLAEVASVEAREIAGVPCQVVTPNGDGPFPVLVWIHGGGFVIGSAELSLGVARELAAGATCVIVSVDYGLAPENRFPGPVDECAAVTRWVLEHAGELGGDPARVAIGGDSAGGNLSAVVALEVPGLVHQLLVYPTVDLTMSYPSIEENAEGYLLTKAAMVWFDNHYLGDHDPKDPRVSPLYAGLAVLASAPPAHVITAEFDPLRDEGEAYAELLREAGVEVHAKRYDGQIHAFFSMGAVMPEGKTAVADAVEQLRAAFS